MSKTALITGITGQDGAYLTKLLFKNGYKNIFGVTRDIENSNTQNLEFLGISKDQYQLLTCDLSDQGQINELIKYTQPHEIYHLAAQSSVGKSFQNPAETLLFNTASVINFLEAIRKINPLIRFYQASSGEMFGNVHESKLPLSENLLFDPASPYGISKAAAHWMVQNYRKNYGIFAACGILFNHESALRGENFVIKKIIHTALKIKSGEASELILGNLDITRDWGYAPKYVEAMWKMLQIDHPDDFVICSGLPLSLSSFIQKVFHALDLDPWVYIKQNPELMRPYDLQIIYGNPTKAKEVLGWNYEMTSDELIQQLIIDEQQWIAWKKLRA